MNSFLFMAPGLILSGMAFVLFAMDASAPGRRGGQAGFWATLVALVAAAALIPHVGFDHAVIYGRGMLISDGLSFVSRGLASSRHFWLWW